MVGNKYFMPLSIILLSICLSFFPPSTAFSATYYIDNNTGNDSNTSVQAQSQSTPWKHMPGMSGCIKSCASYAVRKGDVFVLKGGATWTFTSTTDDLITIGTSGITIKGGQRLGTPWGSGHPVLDATGTSVNCRLGIDIGNHSNITIDGIKIYNTEHSPSGGSGINLGIVNTVEIKNCVLDHTGDQSIRGAGGGSAHLLIHDNSFSNVGRLFIAVSDSTNVDDIQIYNNSFLGVGSWPGGIVGGVHGDGIMIGSGCTAANTCLTNLKIHHNKFSGDWASGATALIFLQNGTAPGSTQYGGNHVQIYDNQVAIDSDGLLGAYIYIWSNWNDIKIYNNTTGGYTGGSNIVPHCIAVTHNATNIDIKNNILSGCSNGITSADSSNYGSITADYNLYSPELVRFLNGWPPGNADCRSISACQVSPFNQEAHGVAGNPKFAALPNGTFGSGNWQLQYDSPARTGGVNLGAPYTTDLDGIVGTRRIGAYERKN